MIKLLLIFLFLTPLYFGYSVAQNNILMYGGGDAQVSSEISEYNNIVSGMPIYGTIMVTHDSNDKVDINSFRLGLKPLKVQLIQSARMSSYSSLEITTYKFQLDGLAKGLHTLPPIKVNIGGKDFEAPPLSIEVAK